MVPLSDLTQCITYCITIQSCFLGVVDVFLTVVEGTKRSIHSPAEQKLGYSKHNDFLCQSLPFYHLKSRCKLCFPHAIYVLGIFAPRKLAKKGLKSNFNPNPKSAYKEPGCLVPQLSSRMIVDYLRDNPLYNKPPCCKWSTELFTGPGHNMCTVNTLMGDQSHMPHMNGCDRGHNL